MWLFVCLGGKGQRKCSILLTRGGREKESCVCVFPSFPSYTPPFALVLTHSQHKEQHTLAAIALNKNKSPYNLFIESIHMFYTCINVKCHDHRLYRKRCVVFVTSPIGFCSEAQCGRVCLSVTTSPNFRLTFFKLQIEVRSCIN